MYSRFFMNRRGNHRKNDGLPIINGKKVQQRRRQKFGLEKPSSSRKSSSGCQLVVSFIVFVILTAFYIHREKSQTLLTGTLNTIGVGERTEEERVAVSATLRPTREKKKNSAEKGSKGLFGMPNKCTDMQLSTIKKQLPDDSLNFRPWRDGSFTLATVRSNYAYNPKLMREFYASDQFTSRSFYAVFVRWRENLAPIDALAIGSRDAKFKIDSSKINDKNALPPVTIDHADGIRSAKVLVADFKPFASGLKTELGFSDDELELLSIEKKELTNGSFASKINSQPIHYLDIAGTDSEDPAVLQSLMPIMNQVRYVHFEYNKDKAWERIKLSSLLQSLKEKGLVCYFAGKKEIDYGLWRVTDCFVDYFDFRHWAYLDCVNVNHEDVGELASRMEQKFLETLKKDISFPVPQPSF